MSDFIVAAIGKLPLFASLLPVAFSDWLNLILPGGVFVAALFTYIRDLLFYKRNNWDFSKQSGFHFNRSDSREKLKVPAKMRLFLFFPMLLFGSGIPALLTGYDLYNRIF